MPKKKPARVKRVTIAPPPVSPLLSAVPISPHSAAALIQAALRGEGPLGKSDPQEPVFLLVGRDLLSAEMVEKWIIRGTLIDVPMKKIAFARDVVSEMMDWPGRRVPD